MENKDISLKIKRIFDVLVSLTVLVLFLPLWLMIAILIKLTSKGPVFFLQDRPGYKRKIFKVYKFRTMKMGSEKMVKGKEVMQDDERITSIGRFLRRTKIDEIPQVLNVLKGEMSLIGPRPERIASLDDYDDEISKRLDMLPGMTGLAQVSGNIYLDLKTRYKLDVYYVEHFNIGLDIWILIRTIGVVLFGEKKFQTNKRENIKMPVNNCLPEIKNIQGIKNVLITGANSYIGTAVEEQLKLNSGYYNVDTLDLVGLNLDIMDFSKYNVVFHVAGIAHRKETKENAHLYYEVNEELAVRVAECAKRDGVSQFIIMSTMNVYGLRKGHITKDTVPNPQSHYGIAKCNADRRVSELANDNFKVVILRPPMVYGKGCKGNYQLLRKFALKSPVFPDFNNRRSMIFIENLAEFVKRVIDNNVSGLYFPQDAEYVNTTEMVKMIVLNNGGNIRMTKLFNPFILLSIKLGIPIFEKVFGDLTYEKVDMVGGLNFSEIMKKVEP